MSEKDGATSPRTVSGPAAAGPPVKVPPRRSAPGSPVVAAPARHCGLPVELTPALQAPHAVERGTQSATHSLRLPTMSNAPRDDLHALREPVAVAEKGGSSMW